MREKPSTHAGYQSRDLELVRQTLLYVATRLGDVWRQVTVVGGLVPSLLIDPARVTAGTPRHIGTRDLDLGLQLAILTDQSYRTLAERLRSAGFRPDHNAKGNLTPQRWVIDVLPNVSVPVDFLIPVRGDDDRAGRTAHLDADFGATIVPGLELAERDRVEVVLSGATVHGEVAQRPVGVCGAGAFVVLKSLAFRLRGENKDAYDLWYVVQHYGAGYEAVATALRPLLDSPHAQQALAYLDQDFTSPERLGPARLAAFLQRVEDQVLRADAAAAFRTLLVLCGEPGDEVA